MISYIIWNVSPEIFSLGPLPIRWYGLFWASGFLVSMQLLYYMFHKEGKPEQDVDTLTIYMLVATVLGARLGHVIFYQPEMFLSEPWSILLPFEFSPFRFTGLQGLASHGAAIGILTGLWLYSKKRKPGQNYLQILDRIVILVALTGAMIRLGNYFNSEIIGKPTHNPFGVVFVNPVTERIFDKEDKANPLSSIEVEKDKTLPEAGNGKVPINLFLFFKPGVSEPQANAFIQNDVKFYLSRYEEFVYQPTELPLYSKISLEKEGTYAAKVSTFGISRHPAQLYEAISSFLLFLFLFWYWAKYKNSLPDGRIFGIFMIVLWSLRFVYEYLKENQVPFEDSLPLNMGQILSIPLVLVGSYILIRSYKKVPANTPL